MSIALILFAVLRGTLCAQEGDTDSSRFSHDGPKLGIGFGGAVGASDLSLRGDARFHAHIHGSISNEIQR
jgi:hypothetical protein